MRPLLFVSLLLLTSPALADPAPRLRLPLDCDLGADCWIMNLADTDPAKGSAKDFHCAGHTYDGHDGTDIAISNRAAMDKGINVLAAQSGKVLRIRDGEEDMFADEDEIATIKKSGKECGNGILIDHGNDWTTQYCHLKKNSLKVKQDDMVKAGQVIAQVGLSGFTEHPHVHLTVRYKSELMDPFTGAPVKDGCGKDNSKIYASLWGERTSDDSFNLYDGGFTADKPDFSKISIGETPPAPDAKSTNVIFWFAYFAAHQGDSISLTITSPSKIVLAETQQIQDKDQARQYLYVGKELYHGLPEKGVYTGEARVTRVSPEGETRTEKITKTFEYK